MVGLLLLPVLSAAAISDEPTLVEHPIASGAEPVYLDGDSWQAHNDGGGQQPLAQCKVPGDIITDLQRAGRVKDPYWNVTWRDPSFIAAWHEGTWTYSRSFPTTAAMHGAAETLLVFDGVRMGASVALNGHPLGNITDQFLRYEYQVSAQLLPPGKENTLTVTFDKSIPTGGRFTYSSQIDWAPVFATTDPTASGVDAQRIEGRETFGFGIWKSVYLLPVKSAAITQLVLHTFYAGGHPTTILSDESHSGFEVRARVVVWAPKPLSGTAKVSIEGVSSGSLQATLLAGVNHLNVTIPAAATKGVRLWHPRGNGQQPRYNVSATFEQSGSDDAAPAGAPVPLTWRLLGFRHVALVTINDTDPAAAATAAQTDGTGQFGMCVPTPPNISLVLSCHLCDQHMSYYIIIDRHIICLGAGTSA